VNVRPFFIAHAEPPELIQPCEGSFHHPAPSPQSAAVFGVALCKKRNDASVTQTLPDRLGVIATVATHAIRSATRTTSFSLESWDGVNQRECLLRIITIGPGELDGQRNSVSVANHMTLAAELGPIGRITARLLPPKTARIELPSTTARDQSISP
jgi:hypothetical protein